MAAVNDELGGPASTVSWSTLIGGSAMVTTYNDPFDALFGLQRALEARLASGWLGDSTASTGTFPPINMFVQEDYIVAVVELPGVTKNDLQIQARENWIRISGKKAINYEEGVSLHRRERVSGSFDRTLTVPVRIDPDRIKCEYRDGILALSIPRAESDKPRTIEIQ
jgi:HSP20 family protein